VRGAPTALRPGHSGPAHTGGRPGDDVAVAGTPVEMTSFARPLNALHYEAYSKVPLSEINDQGSARPVMVFERSSIDF
jgi:hypothetical protein